MTSFPRISARCAGVIRATCLTSAPVCIICAPCFRSAQCVCRVSAAVAPRGREHCACARPANRRASPPAPPDFGGVFVCPDQQRNRPMHALKPEAFIVRPAVPADVPALVPVIAKVDEETEFLGKPGEYERLWAPGLPR